MDEQDEQEELDEMHAVETPGLVDESGEPVEPDDGALPPGPPPLEAPIEDWVDQQRDVPLDDDGPHDGG